jgi:hypothetical protein
MSDEQKREQEQAGFQVIEVESHGTSESRSFEAQRDEIRRRIRQLKRGTVIIRRNASGEVLRRAVTIGRSTSHGESRS